MYSRCWTRRLAVELKTALAVSLSYDGSVDAYQEGCE